MPTTLQQDPVEYSTLQSIIHQTYVQIHFIPSHPILTASQSNSTIGPFSFFGLCLFHTNACSAYSIQKIVLTCSYSSLLRGLVPRIYCPATLALIRNRGQGNLSNTTTTRSGLHIPDQSNPVHAFCFGHQHLACWRFIEANVVSRSSFSPFSSSLSSPESYYSTPLCNHIMPSLRENKVNGRRQATDLSTFHSLLFSLNFNPVLFPSPSFLSPLSYPFFMSVRSYFCMDQMV